MPAVANAEPVGFWVRAVARLIDTSLLFIIADALIVAFAELVGNEHYSLRHDLFDLLDGSIARDFSNGQCLVILAAFNLGIVIYFTSLGAMQGQAVGKAFVGARIVSFPHSSRIGMGRSLCRWLANYVSAIPLGMGFLMILSSKDRRALHDRLVGTHVIGTTAMRAGRGLFAFLVTAALSMNWGSHRLLGIYKDYDAEFPLHLFTWASWFYVVAMLMPAMWMISLAARANRDIARGEQLAVWSSTVALIVLWCCCFSMPAFSVYQNLH